MRRPRRGPSRDYSRILSEFTPEELTFLTLHARHGPIVRSDVVARHLGFDDESALLRSVQRGETPLDVFRPTGRLKVRFAAAVPLSKLLVARRLPLADASIPESWSFSGDDTSGPEILVLGKAVPADRFRAMTLRELTALRMHARYGPVVTSAKAAELLWYANSRTLIAAIHDGQCPIGLVVPQGRHKGFASTRAIAWHLADLAIPHHALPQDPSRAPET